MALAAECAGTPRATFVSHTCGGDVLLYLKRPSLSSVLETAFEGKVLARYWCELPDAVRM